MMPKRFGRNDYSCRGRHEKWLFTVKSSGLSLWRVVEFIDGEKYACFEVRHCYDGGCHVMFESDDYRTARDYANGWV